MPYPRVYVRAGSVDSSIQSAAAEALRATALPAFIRWLQGILALPNESSILFSDLHFDADFTTDELTIIVRPEFKNPIPSE